MRHTHDDLIVNGEVWSSGQCEYRVMVPVFIEGHCVSVSCGVTDYYEESLCMKSVQAHITSIGDWIN
jgi:hypothetical protein